MRIALIGATGLVGQTLLRVLDERQFPVDELLLVASERSIGQTIAFRGGSYAITGLQDALERQPDIAFFSAGGSISQQWAPRFRDAGSLVIDNSSAWRMAPDVPLVVPEINLGSVGNSRLIANPNCSTIQLVMALKPLHDAFGLKRVVVSTYQSVTGTGKQAVDQLLAERQGTAAAEPAYPHPIGENVLPHCDVFLDDGTTKEERKVVNETRKILNLPELPITCTAVRVPVRGGHSESVNVEFERPCELQTVQEALAGMPGVVVEDEPAANRYPMPLTAEGKDEVFVGRLRRDESIQNGLNLWVVADNLRKGAATNAVQIAHALRERTNVSKALR